MRLKRIMAGVVALMLVALMTAMPVNAASSNSVPQLTVNSDILALVDTGNKTTLKAELMYTSGPGDINIYYYGEDGKRTVYAQEHDEGFSVKLDPVSYSGSAVLDLGDVDDKLIDSSKATVKLLDGNAYYADEMVLSASASKLDGEWMNGKYEYTLDVGDLDWNTWGYDTTLDYNSGREWSIMGGDGCGVYTYRFEVSGITYDGMEVAPAIFPVVIYTYGRSCMDMAASTEFVENTYDTSYTSGLAASDKVQWAWHTENSAAVEHGKPYLNDEYSDYFSIVWPKGTNASSISADDVTIKLKSKFGDEYTLSTSTAYGEHEYAVIANKGETMIAVTYQQWALVPVYSTMEIAVDDGTLKASQTYDICSVAAYQVQTGGGGVETDNTVTAKNFYGVLGMTLENAANTNYTLSTVVDGTTYFYAEDENGNGYLSAGVEETNAWGRTSVNAPADAWTGDATEHLDIAVHGNVVFARDKRKGITVDKVVEGKTITFNQNIGMSFSKNISEMIAGGAYLDDGYNLSGASTEKWAWTTRYKSGWSTYFSQPTGLPYVNGIEADGYGYGYLPGGTNKEYDVAYDAEMNSADNGPGGPGSGPNGPGGPGDPSNTEPAEKPEQPSNSTNATTYVVVSGDTLWSIAKKFYGTGAKWGIIFEANRGTVQNGNRIYVGQTLIIPAE